MIKHATSKKSIAIVLAISILFASCVSTTLIQTEPPGATVFIDGQRLGVTPFSYSDTRIIGSVVNLRLEKEGYEPIYTFFVRNEQVDVGAIVGGLFIWVPFLWSMKYNPYRTYYLNLSYDETFPAINETHEIIVYPKYQKLRDLKVLLDQGIITKEEFELEKQKILKQD